MGHGFSKRGSVDLCFSSETLSVVYRDNGDLSEMWGMFYFEQNFRIKASSATLMMKIVLCSSKFHVKCISILTTLGSVSQGGPSVPCLASPVEFWSEVCQCYYLHILGVLVFMIFWQ